MSELTSESLLAHLRETWIEEEGCWDLSDLAKYFDVDVKTLYDEDTDSGLLFHLSRDGKVTLQKYEASAGVFDYMIFITPPNIEWD